MEDRFWPDRYTKQVAERREASLRHFDTNKGGFLDFEELNGVATQLIEHHQPGAMSNP